MKPVLDRYESWDHYATLDPELHGFYKSRLGEPAPIVDRKLGFSLRRCKFEFRWALRAAGVRMRWGGRHPDPFSARRKPAWSFMASGATMRYVGQVREWDLVRDPWECARRVLRVIA